MQIKKLNDEIGALKDLQRAQDAALLSSTAREKDLRALVAERDLSILNLQHQLQCSQQVPCCC
jgi:DNA transposition AAA+ family ATPase